MITHLKKQQAHDDVLGHSVASLFATGAQILNVSDGHGTATVASTRAPVQIPASESDPGEAHQDRISSQSPSRSNALHGTASALTATSSPSQPLSRSSTTSPARLGSTSPGPKVHHTQASYPGSAGMEDSSRSKEPVGRFTVAGPSKLLQRAGNRTERSEGRESISPPTRRKSLSGDALQTARGRPIAVRTRNPSSASDGRSSSAHSQNDANRRSSSIAPQGSEHAPLLGAGDKGKAPANHSDAERAHLRPDGHTRRELAPQSPATTENAVTTSLAVPGKRARSKDPSPPCTRQRPRLGPLSSTGERGNPIVNVHRGLPVYKAPPSVKPESVVRVRAPLPSEVAARRRAAARDLTETTRSPSAETKSKSPSPNRRR